VNKHTFGIAEIYIYHDMDIMNRLETLTDANPTPYPHATSAHDNRS